MKLRKLALARKNLSGALKSIAIKGTGETVISTPSPSLALSDSRIFLQIPRFALIIAALFLSACATTSKPLQFTSMPDFGIDKTSEDQGNKLQALSHEELITRGNQFLQERNTRLARLHFRIAIEKKNDSAPAYAGLGEALALENENKAAHQVLDKALALDARNRQALIAEAKLYEKERNFTKAEINFNRALEIYPDDPEIMTELAITYGNDGKADLAEKFLSKVVSEKPGDSAAYNNLGFNYLLQEKYTEAIETLQSALSFNPGDSRIRNNLAAAYALNNKNQKAFELLSRTEGEAAAYNDLGYFYMKRGLKEPARNSFKKALELNPKLYVRAQENLRRLDEDL